MCLCLHVCLLPRFIFSYFTYLLLWQHEKLEITRCRRHSQPEHTVQSVDGRVSDFCTNWKVIKHIYIEHILSMGFIQFPNRSGYQISKLSVNPPCCFYIILYPFLSLFAFRTMISIVCMTNLLKVVILSLR